MNITELFTFISENIADKQLIDKTIDSQPLEIRTLLYSSSNEMVKSLFPKRQSYINEVKVTVY